MLQLRLSPRRPHSRTNEKRWMTKVASQADMSYRLKALAELLSQEQAGKNHYQGIFAELYRRFGVSSYKLIRQEQYASVLAFLEEWHRTNGG